MMEDLKQTIASNVTDLRRLNGMTQLELAEKLNYTDKAVSKWERGESMPDITVLKAIADLFGVSVDYLLTEDHSAHEAPSAGPDPALVAARARNRKIITGLAILLVVLLSTFAFVVVGIVSTEQVRYAWLAFVYAVPVSLIVWLVFNSVWFDRQRNYLIVSLLMWSVLISVHLTFVLIAPTDIPMWFIYFLGIPGQLIILTWSRMYHPKKPKK